MADQQQPQQHEMNAVGTGGGLNLPIGFRFHPSDDEIISAYLTKKVCNRDFTSVAITEVNLNKFEPWDLPSMAKIGEKEWYFFYQKDRKYPTGQRANRATEAGYWKATGRDKEVYSTTEGVMRLVGMKKTLVFYRGRAPRGEKTNWVMHEYRLEGIGRLPGGASASNLAANTAAMEGLACGSMDEWVVCRLFHKTTRTKNMTASASQVAMASTGIDQNHNNILAGIIPMPVKPMEMQFPILTDFAMDLVVPYCSNTGAGMLPMEGIGGASGLQINNTLFGNLLAAMPQMNFNQMGMGAPVGHMGMGAASHMCIGVAPDSCPSSMVSQKDE